MKFEDYSILKNDDMFRRKTTQVCELCYLDITKYCEMLSEKITRRVPKLENIKPSVNNSSKVNLWKQTMNLNKLKLKQSHEINNNFVNNFVNKANEKFATGKAEHKIIFKKPLFFNQSHPNDKDNISTVSDLPNIKYKSKNHEKEDKEEILFLTEELNKSTKENER